MSYYLGDLGIVVCLDDGHLAIGGIDLRCAAIFVVEVAPLWNRGPKRGENVTLDGAQGTRSYEETEHEASYSLLTLVSGEVAWDAPTVPTALGVWQQIRLNHLHYQEQLVDPPGTARGTRDAVLTWPDGVTTDEGPVQVHGLPLEAGRIVEGHFGVAHLELTVPFGHLVTQP